MKDNYTHFRTAPSTSFLDGVVFTVLPKRECTLSYKYEGFENSTITEKLIFKGVESFKCTYYKACSLEMIKSYAKINEIRNSKWLAEIISNLRVAGNTF